MLHLKKLLCTAALLMATAIFAQTYDLPIIFVDTKYHQCLDDKIIEKIPATIRVLDGKTNNVADSSKATPYEIGIKVRGRGSSGFPKLNYTIEYHDSTDKDINVSLLGLPPSDDWVLHGPYVDKSMVRNSFGHWLFRQTGRYSPRTKHFDLYINGVYRGVYVLIERIKRDKYRVNVSKLKKTDIEGDNLTGGYILAIDRKYDSYSKLSKTESEFVTSDGVKVILRYPKKDKMAKEQEEYIQNYLNELEALFKDGKSGSGYEKYVDIVSAADYLLHLELTNNIDPYLANNFFMYKPKDKTDDQGNKTVGKITLGPPWDFYLAFKNRLTPESSNDDKNGTDSTISSQYQYDNIWIIEKLYTSFTSFLGWHQANWVFEMWKDSIFQIEVSKRWAELRSGVWHTKTIDAYLDSMKTHLKSAADRNFKRWPTLGKASGQNDPDPEPMKYCDTTIRSSNFMGLAIGGYNADTWEGEFEHVRKTTKERIAWMDKQFGFTEPTNPVAFEPIIHEPDWRAEMGDTSDVHIHSDNFSRLSPTNFFTVNGDHLEIHTSVGGSFALMDLNGAVLYKVHIKTGVTSLTIPAKARDKHWIATLNGKMMNR